MQVGWKLHEITAGFFKKQKRRPANCKPALRCTTDFQVRRNAARVDGFGNPPYVVR